VTKEHKRKGRSPGRKPAELFAIVERVWDKDAEADLQRAFEILLAVDLDLPEMPKSDGGE
jgi:hypothetical protein